MKRLVTSTIFFVALLASGAASAQESGGSDDSGLQAGGLRPPPPEGESDESAKTEEKLETAEKEDSGRGLEFVYLNLEGGIEHLGLQTFHANNMIDARIGSTTQTGPLFGAGAGLRLLFITVGPRFRLAHFSSFDMWTLGAEVGLRIPLGNLEPYFVLGGGYASLGAFNGNNIANSGDVAIRGYNIRGGGGFDYYVTPVFSIGVNVQAELLGLSRPGVNLQGLGAAVTPAQGTVNYASDGSSLGFGVAGTAVVGLHF